MASVTLLLQTVALEQSYIRGCLPSRPCPSQITCAGEGSTVRGAGALPAKGYRVAQQCPPKPGLPRMGKQRGDVCMHTHVQECGRWSFMPHA